MDELVLKKPYEKPEIEVIELVLENSIANSGFTEEEGMFPKLW